MKSYSDATVTKDDLETLHVHLTAKQADEFSKFKMTMLALIVSQVIGYALLVYLLLRH